MNCNFMLSVLALASVVTCLPAVAGTSNTFRVEGVVDSINQDDITLWVRGKLVKVKRNTIPEIYKVTPGERVEAYVPSETVVATAKKKR